MCGITPTQRVLWVRKQNAGNLPPLTQLSLDCIFQTGHNLALASSVTITCGLSREPIISYVIAWDFDKPHLVPCGDIVSEHAVARCWKQY